MTSLLVMSVNIDWLDWTSLRMTYIRYLTSTTEDPMEASKIQMLNIKVQGFGEPKPRKLEVCSKSRCAPSLPLLQELYGH